MTKRTFTLEKKDPTHNQVWEWDETPELVRLLEKLHTTDYTSSTGSDDSVA